MGAGGGMALLEDIVDAAIMAEAMEQVVPRNAWIPEYREAAELARLDTLF